MSTFLLPSEIVSFVDDYGWNPDVPALQDSQEPLYIDRIHRDFIEKLIFRLDRLDLDSLQLTAADRLELEESIMLCRSAARDWAQTTRSETRIVGESGKARDNPVVVIRKILDSVEGMPTEEAVPAEIAEESAYNLVFISHAATDRPLAERVDREIKARFPGTNTFIASRPGDIPSGEWFDTVKSALQEADAYLTIITPTSKKRPWVLWEHGAAWMSGRTPLITARVEIGTAEIPEPLRLFQIHALDDIETAAEVFKELGDAGEDLDEFCEQIAALAATIPRPEGAPAPIELRWGGGNLNGWNEVSRNLGVYLRGEGPVRISEINALMWHRDAPEETYPAMPQSLLQVPVLLGRGQESFAQALRFNTTRIPKELRGGGTAANQLQLQANVSYVDSKGRANTIASAIHDV